MRIGLLLVTAGVLASGCSTNSPASTPLPHVTAPVPGVTLPPDPLRSLVPSPIEVPPGLVPLVVATGPRTITAIAGFSADPKAATKTLIAHHFRHAYVAQYADPADGRLLSIVVSMFTSDSDASRDYDSDVRGSGGVPVSGLESVGAASDVRRQVLPGRRTGQLITVRFRQGLLTWLVAYGASPTADPTVPVALGRLLAARALP